MNHAEPTVSLKTTLATGAMLLALWGTSFALSFVGLGAWALPVALAIATAKAVLVVLVFMEIAVERFSVQAAIGAAIAMVALLVGFMVADVRARAPQPFTTPSAQVTDANARVTNANANANGRAAAPR